MSLPFIIFLCVSFVVFTVIITITVDIWIDQRKAKKDNDKEMEEILKRMQIRMRD